MSKPYTPGPAPPVRIARGYLPGCIGRIVDMHARFYDAHAGFGAYFESKVAAGLAEFVERLDRPGNALWLALSDTRIAGSLAIDGEDLGDGRAHLRWFIMDEDLRGAGAGQQLLDAALAFCAEQRYASIHLWTFKGLDAARRLYEKNGFLLQEEWLGTQWGSEVTEQRFVKDVGGSA